MPVLRRGHKDMATYPCNPRRCKKSRWCRQKQRQRQWSPQQQARPRAVRLVACGRLARLPAPRDGRALVHRSLGDRQLQPVCSAGASRAPTAWGVPWAGVSAVTRKLCHKGERRVPPLVSSVHPELTKSREAGLDPECALSPKGGWARPGGISALGAREKGVA